MTLVNFVAMEKIVALKFIFDWYRYTTYVSLPVAGRQCSRSLTLCYKIQAARGMEENGHFTCKQDLNILQDLAVLNASCKGIDILCASFLQGLCKMTFPRMDL